MSAEIDEIEIPATATSVASVSPWRLYTQRQRWVFLTILYLVTTSNYFDYFVVSIVLEPIKKEFHASDTGLGLLSGFSFAVLYSITALPIARWADRGNRRTVITLSLAAWSVMTAVCGIAQSFWQLILTRSVVGAVEPGALPPAQSLIIDYFPPERRATAIAILSQGGSAAGWLFGVGIGGYIAATYGWRTTFLLAGIPGLVLAAIAWLILREPRMCLGFPVASHLEEPMSQTIRRLWAKRSFAYALIGLSLYAIFTFGLATFVPSFMIRSLHASLEQLSFTWGVAICVANLLGALCGGWLADWLGRRDPRWYAWLPALACGSGVLTYGVALLTERLWTFIVTDFIAEFMCAVGLPAVFMSMHAVCGARRRTLAVAVALLLFSLIGSGIGPPAVGAVSDAFAVIVGSESLRYSLMAILIFLIPASVAFYRAGCAMPDDLEP